MEHVTTESLAGLTVPLFSMLGCREKGCRPEGWRDEKGGGAGGVLRGEQAEERRRALEHIHRLTLAGQMENGA